MYIYGLDVSTTRLGIAILNEKQELIYNDALKFDSKKSLEERAKLFYNKMYELKHHFPPDKIYIEEPAKLFNKTTAHTVAILNQFNGMCRLTAHLMSDQVPIMVNVRTARKKLGISPDKQTLKEYRGSPADKKRYVKRVVIDYVKNKFDNFVYTETRHGNPSPGIDDKADAVVMALQEFV